jgi:hypothetical protein
MWVCTGTKLTVSTFPYPSRRFPFSNVSGPDHPQVLRPAFHVNEEYADCNGQRDGEVLTSMTNALSSDYPDWPACRIGAVPTNRGGRGCLGALQMKIAFPDKSSIVLSFQGS